MSEKRMGEAEIEQQPDAAVRLMNPYRSEFKEAEKEERTQKRKRQCWAVLKAFIAAHPLGLTDYELVSGTIGGTDGPRRRRELKRRGINFTVSTDAKKGVSRWSLTSVKQANEMLKENGIELNSAPVNSTLMVHCDS